MASLFVIRGRDQGKHYALDNARYTIGRDISNDIQLIDSEVSRQHAQVFTEGEFFEVMDLGSSNGTSVNGSPVNRCILKSGDRLQVGATMMIFTGNGEPTTMEGQHGVDIIQQSRQMEGSQIVSSLSRVVDNDAEMESSQVKIDARVEVMYHTALAVGRTLEIPQLLDRILRLVFDWVAADRGCIMLSDPETKELRPAARCDRSEGPIKDRIAISRTILDYVIEKNEGVRTRDAKDDGRWDSGQSIVRMGIREAICVPLQGRYDVVGAMYVDTFTPPGHFVDADEQGRFVDEHLKLMTAIGHQAALAIEDTFYYSSLLQSERLAAMGQTIATLSHHIKNILQGIRGGSYLIETGLDRNDNEAVRKGWAMVDKNQDKISNLVLDMLTFSKEREPELAEGDLNATVADVVELMQVRADEADCHLEVQLDKSLPSACFDADAMHRAVLNIVTNAIDAVDSADRDDGVQQPSVRISTSYVAGEGFYIDIADNGPGIDAADIEKIFSLFESKKGARGTGLGLPVSQKIMQEHGGEILLESQRGSGTKFRLHLPAADSAPDTLI
ncbi:ATP-binding protein [Rosistilla oblonga]|uniref:ATP-binding protein n=1 Tax=Rosistilla oblonga TaxID=2527990 RepID=UPI003A976233